MPPKKNKKKNDDFEDYFFEDADAVKDVDTKNDASTTGPAEDDSLAKPVGNKKDKKKKKKGQGDEDDMYNFAEPSDNAGATIEVAPGKQDETLKPANNKKDKKGKKKANLADADDFYNFEDGPDDAESNKTPTAPAENDEMSKPAANKKDKKKKKKGAADEDEMYNFADPSDDVGDLKEAAVSEGIGKPAKDTESSKTLSKKDKKKKKGGADDDDMCYFAGDTEDTRPKIPVETAPVKGAVTVEQPVLDSDQEEEGSKIREVKSAAEKKAEKKKRDAEKRKAEKLKEEERLRKLAEQQAKNEEKERAKREAEEAQLDKLAKANEGETAAADEEAEKGAKGKKKQRGLGGATMRALQEELERKKAEEEKVRKEQEELQRVANEMKFQQEEAERLEKERKEKKKQKRKDEIARQKDEGTYMTKTQKAQKAKIEQARKLFLEQGNVIIPAAANTQAHILPPSRKLKHKNNYKSANEEEAKKQELIEDQMNGEKEAEDVIDNWEDESDDDWEKMDEEKEKDGVMENGGDSTGTACKVNKLAHQMREVKLTNGDISGCSQKVPEADDDDGESSDEETSSSEEESGIFSKEEILERIKQRRAESDSKRDVTNPRAAVVCVLGHVDTGKTKILDKIRRTNVQDGEAGGITQQIGATNMPNKAIAEWSRTANVKGFDEAKMKLPGFLVIDTPGHESFTNLRSRGSSLCDLAILVVDIMHGLEPQTLESINLLKERQAPFVVALNKIDRLFEWKSNPVQDIRDTIKKQKKHTRDEFEARLKQIISEFAVKCLLNVIPFWDNEDPANYVSICPTSAHTGDGMGNMIWYMVNFCQNHLKKRLAFRTEPQATVLEIKEIQGLGTTIDVILVNGKLKEGDPIIVAGYEGPIQTHVKALLAPPAMKELRVKSQYEKLKQVKAATGIKILARDVEKALAGMPMLVAAREDEVEVLTEEMQKILANMISSIKLNDKGVYVQASTLGSLEALLEFLKQSQIPYSGINIGPVHKKDVMKASTMLEHSELYGVILAFDVKVERDALELAETSGIKIFTADIIYHLFDKFQAYKEELRQKAKDKHRHIAVFPCKLRILPNCIFNSRDPIIIGVTVEAGIVKPGTQLCVPSKEGLLLGTVASIEVNNRPVDFARQGTDVCLKIENTTGEAPKLYGRHFDSTDLLISKLSRESIDALKDHFRDEMQKNDWLLVKELKTIFRIV